MKVQVLTDNEAVGFVVEVSTLELGYECSVTTRIADFKARSRASERYYLILDYLLAEGDCRQFLLELLNSASPPAGLLVMSGLPGFEDFLNEVSESYADANIPFLFLEKPFGHTELGELLRRLGKGIEGRIYGCLRLPKYNSINRGKCGPILRAARENLGLKLQDVVIGASKKGLWLTQSRLEEIEIDETGATVTPEEWFILRRLLYESSGSLNTGFEPWMHLSRVRHALEKKSYPFAMNFTLRRKLVELATREKIEAKFFDIANYRISQQVK